MLKTCMYANVAEAGCDEAGRGCLAGPVVAAAVILPPDYTNPDINDSKKLSASKRVSLQQTIKNEAIAWAVASVSAEIIDKINILRASILAMHRALENLEILPDHILIDGNRFYPFHKVEFHTVVKGDATYLNIAAASILAKTARDEMMAGLAEEYPGYGWERNMGYPTTEHRSAIRRLGLTPYHRRSFGPCQPTLF